MTGQSGQKTTGGKISPLSKFVSTPGEKVRQGASDPLYEITEVNNGISLSLRMGRGRRIALRITKFRNNRGHARESYDPRSFTLPWILAHRSRIITHRIVASRESLNVHRIFLCSQKKKRTCRGIFAAVDLIFPVRSDPIIRGNLTRRLWSVRKSTEKKKKLFRLKCRLRN